MVYITRGLLTVLLDIAREAEPSKVTVSLSVSPAGDLDGDVDLDPEIPVFTDFYLPDAGKSVSAVFGVDLSTPARQTQGRFVSHPQGGLEITRRDDLHGVVFVATPPWDDTTVAAFTRHGARQEIEVVDAEPPEGTIG